MKQTLLKYTALSIVAITSSNAAENSMISSEMAGYLGLSAIFVMLFLLYILFKQKGALKQQETLLKEKDEKIKWLREIGVQNEQRRIAKEKELEKSITELNHTIEVLEQKAKEGTKNEVLMKIEALQEKRERVLQRSALER